MRVLTLTLLCAALAGCPQRVAQAPQSTPVLPPTSIAFSFDGVKPGGTLAQLTYAVSSPLGISPMSLADPTKPKGTELKLDLAKLRLKPYVMRPEITQRWKQQCLVNCCYTLCVRDAADVHVGDFEVNPWGALVLKRGTVDDALIVQRGSIPGSKYVMGRTIYFVFAKRRGGGRGELQFALEYQRRPALTERLLTAADGWHYTFASPDGALLLHPPNPEMPQMLDELLAAEAAMVEESEGSGKKSGGKPNISFNMDMGGGGGDYCTGGG